MKQAQIKFNAALEALAPLTKQNAGIVLSNLDKLFWNQRSGEKILAPLTNSLYVPGTLNNVEKVIVDVGTGYFMEKSIPDARDFYSRKIDFLRANLEKLQETISAKQSHHRLVMDVIQYKFAMFEQEKQSRTEIEAWERL